MPLAMAVWPLAISSRGQDRDVRDRASSSARLVRASPPGLSQTEKRCLSI